MNRGIMRMGSIFKDASFENYKVKPSNKAGFDACVRLAEGESSGVLLTGPCGTGKTHLLVSVVRRLEENYRKRTAQFRPSTLDPVEVGSLLEIFKRAAEEYDPADEASIQAPSLTPDECISAPRIEMWPVLEFVRRLRGDLQDSSNGGDFSERCCRCDLLILDDFGQERISGKDGKMFYIFEELERIIDWRYRNQLPVAISTNLSIEDVVEKYGERIISRWSQLCEFVSIEGEDMRIVLGKEKKRKGVNVG